MEKVEMPHPGHEEHLCWLINMGFQRQRPDEYKALVREGRYMCEGCGRVAVNKDNLCRPVELHS